MKLSSELVLLKNSSVIVLFDSTKKKLWPGTCIGVGFGVADGSGFGFGEGGRCCYF